MTKNEIYLDILSSSLPYLRNIATHSLFRRIRDRSVYYETQLIHSFYRLLAHDDIDDGDIHFLNYHCKDYFYNSNKNISILYDSNIKNISKLFSIVPENLRSQLIWNGPGTNN
ncbi:hypothetical protein [Klebsiella sp. BIGb0407]|uniref:hypothetical protein n=1 Tax=Klebsiella sp. BIGb0407 TaxID=2940603 RepID=UPI002168660E|nr:hypothetical protein [Klebsiella sp. BIGb0407]MCS3432455.1 hypothetical protein [Klebsiella sp. BIGb0407]